MQPVCDGVVVVMFTVARNALARKPHDAGAVTEADLRGVCCVEQRDRPNLAAVRANALGAHEAQKVAPSFGHAGVAAEDAPDLRAREFGRAQLKFLDEAQLRARV